MSKATPEEIIAAADTLSKLFYEDAENEIGNPTTYFGRTEKQLREIAEARKPKPVPAKVYVRFNEFNGETAVFVEKSDGSTAAVYVNEGYFSSSEFDSPPTLFASNLVFGGK